MSPTIKQSAKFIYKRASTLITIALAISISFNVHQIITQNNYLVNENASIMEATVRALTELAVSEAIAMAFADSRAILIEEATRLEDATIRLTGQVDQIDIETETGINQAFRVLEIRPTITLAIITENEPGMVAPFDTVLYHIELEDSMVFVPLWPGLYIELYKPDNE